MLAHVLPDDLILGPPVKWRRKFRNRLPELGIVQRKVFLGFGPSQIKVERFVLEYIA